MHLEKTFKTKTGYCHIIPDKIILTRDGIIGDIANLTMGNNIARPLILYGLAALTLFTFGIKGLLEGQASASSIFLLLAIFLVVGILKSLNNSATPIIYRKDISQITFKKAIPGATRAYFIIVFKNDKGKQKRRLILLPGSLSAGQSESEKALIIMNSEFPHIENAS